MAIIFNEENKTFTLQTKKSTYQMKVDERGALLHTYFGEKTDESDYSYLIDYADRGFSGNPGDVIDTRMYSFDFLPQEYPVYGTGDYRVSCLRITDAEGASACDLRYKGHEIHHGKYQLEGLPALFDSEKEQGDTLIITLKDRVKNLEVQLYYGVLEETGVITRSAVVNNYTGENIEINRIMSGCLELQNKDMELIHFHGRHAMERQFERKELLNGIISIRSNRGTSSHHHNPFFILCEKQTGEDRGVCYGFSFLYSGGFHMQAEVDSTEQTRIVMGIDDEAFSYQLKDGETFVSPELCMVYTKEGFSDLSHIFHDVYNEHLIRSVWKDKMRPILVNNWEATYFEFTGEKLLTIAKQAAELGLDMLVLDDGWFGKREDDNSGLGDWFVNEKKLGCSLKELAEKVNQLGLKFGLWFEPEMISEDSDLYRNHPDWALAIPNREPVRSRNQLVLDFSRKDVREYVKERLFAIMDSANIEYVKWDMNRSIAHVYSAILPVNRQGEIRHRYVLGLYEVLEDMLKRYPNLLLEGCSGGGGRFDAGMLYYSPQIWCSDNTDAIDRTKIQYGTSFGYPISSISAHVSVCPNHQNGRVTPLKTRGICAYQGSFGYELDISKMTEEEKTMVKEQVKEYKENYELFLKGDYYRLVSPMENRDYVAWQFVSKSKEKVGVCIVYTDIHGNGLPTVLKLKGLQKDAIYAVEGKQYTGVALMNGGYKMPRAKEQNDAYFVLLEKVQA